MKVPRDIATKLTRWGDEREIVRELLLMAPDLYLFNEEPLSSPLVDVDVFEGDDAVLEDMARSWGFTPHGLLLALSVAAHRAAAARIAHDDEKARPIWNGK